MFKMRLFDEQNVTCTVIIYRSKFLQDGHPRNVFFFIKRTEQMWCKVTIDYLKKYILVELYENFFAFLNLRKYLMVIIVFFVNDYFEILDKKMKLNTIKIIIKYNKLIDTLIQCK